MNSQPTSDESQIPLFIAPPSTSNFPATRYQGSKRRILDWLWDEVGKLDFDTCLDLFSGTSSVSYLLKVHGKQVTSNDKYRFNGVVARALVANNKTRLPLSLLDELFTVEEGKEYDDLVSQMFEGIFFLPEENRKLDIIVQNIHGRLTGFQRDLALYSLFQACLAKRPYNLFHRANLYMRTSDVERSFGNKTTWDRSFRDHMQQALAAANAAVFDNGRSHNVLTSDFLDVPGSYDLVYMDPPYLNSKGTGVDYLDFYHFLEGLTEYNQWRERISTRHKHRPYRRDKANPWNDKSRILGAFDDAIDRYAGSIIAISYRSTGVPSIDDLIGLLERHGRTSLSKVAVDHKYVLSTARNKEVLLLSGPSSARN